MYLEQNHGGQFRVSTADPPRTRRALADVIETVVGSIGLDEAFDLASAFAARTCAVTVAELWLQNKERTALELTKTKDTLRRRTNETNIAQRLDDCFSFGTVHLSGDKLYVPLKNGEEVFGVLVLLHDAHAFVTPDERMIGILGTGVSRLILGSLSFERSRSHALTDAITDLPNQWAFDLMLKDQLAASISRGRPLSVVVMDISGFKQINGRYGHGTGDEVLRKTARLIQDNIRQMDFLARSYGDEFLVLLPGASHGVYVKIIGRINSAMCQTRSKLSCGESMDITLNFGWAEAGTDGDSARDLLTAARLRRAVTTSSEPGNVLLFPRGLRV